MFWDVASAGLCAARRPTTRLKQMLQQHRGTILIQKTHNIQSAKLQNMVIRNCSRLLIVLIWCTFHSWVCLPLCDVYNGLRYSITLGINTLQQKSGTVNHNVISCVKPVISGSDVSWSYTIHAYSRPIPSESLHCYYRQACHTGIVFTQWSKNRGDTLP